METCPNCGTKLTTSIFKENLPLNNKEVELINRFSEFNCDGYCQKCNNENNLLGNAKKEYFKLKNELADSLNAMTSELTELSQFVPIVSLHTPQDWKYKSIEIISAQVVSGTGIVAEITSNWTDFFGMDSGVYNEKVKNAEVKCKSLLRMQTINLGGNAILGTDIDYSEAGGGKGMLMVCMAGTAVKITNLQELEYNSSALNKLGELVKSIKEKIALQEELNGFGNFY
ncbi:MAG: YbjQ family protein [Algoriphagus aquaeductus]|uniref:YbjQ family protein n=1 Tax=Algoriphagus aquaeductus TaxID=475299 RepID=UPI003879B16D